MDQLRNIAGKLLGTTDIITSPAHIEADFRAILDKTLRKTVSDVFLRLWTPQGARVKFCKEVSPEIVDLTGRGPRGETAVAGVPHRCVGQGGVA